MLRIFTYIADLLTWQLFNLEAGSRIGEAVHFFIEDVTKIYFLLFLMIYVIALFRAGLDTERVRAYLSGKNRFVGYFLATIFGSVTPFCSCSSIPLFLGFTSAGIPLGITMAFLITSPMINEVAVVLLGSMLGVKFLVLYVVTGILAGVIGGALIDLLKADRYLTPIGKRAAGMGADNINVEGLPENGSALKIKLSMKERHVFAWDELKSIFSRVWKWVLIGVGLGAALHGFIPDGWITAHLGSGAWWSVPGAVLLGIPLYSGASGVIPVIESLLNHGLPVGTAMAFMMSVVAASFPEFMMLKQVMKPKLLIMFFIMLLVFFTLAGWLFNVLY
ncbi:MAG: permease [Spirochaetales bacterium]|nr:permease [Spirochaetales bacterium]